MSCMLTAEAYAERMGVSVKTVRERCARGFYEGAFKEGRRWYIPIEERQQTAQEIADEAFQIFIGKMRDFFGKEVR